MPAETPNLHICLRAYQNVEVVEGDSGLKSGDGKSPIPDTRATIDRRNGNRVSVSILIAVKLLIGDVDDKKIQQWHTGVDAQKQWRSVGFRHDCNQRRVQPRPSWLGLQAQRGHDTRLVVARTGERNESEKEQTLIARRICSQISVRMLQRVAEEGVGLCFNFAHDLSCA